MVVSKAESPMNLAPVSFTVSMIFRAGTSTPRSMTSNPLAESIMPTIFFPISWISPETVARITLPFPLSVTRVHTFFQEGHGFLDDLPCHDEVSQEIFSFLELAAHGFEPSAYAFLNDCLGHQNLVPGMSPPGPDVIEIEFVYCSPYRQDGFIHLKPPWV